MALVIKEWFAEETPKDGVYVKIVGRNAGIVAWVLSLVGIDPTVSFTVEEKHLVTEAASWSGFLRQVVPTRSVSRTYYGFKKPWLAALAVGIFVGFLVWVVLGAILGYMAGGGWGTFLGFVGGVGAGIYLGHLYYKFETAISVGFVEISAWSFALAFKRSFIEGQAIDEKSAEKVASIIRARIDSATHS